MVAKAVKVTMPILATGNRRAQAGFTLVELMIVLAIVGLMTTIAVLNFPSSGDGLGREGDRFAARLLHARDIAILANRETAAVVDAQGYHFVTRQGESWSPIEERPLVATRWDDNTKVAIDGPTLRIVFDTVGMSTPRTVQLSNDEHQTSVKISASGEVRVDAAR